jgi:hypothetical protein
MVGGGIVIGKNRAYISKVFPVKKILTYFTILLIPCVRSLYPQQWEFTFHCDVEKSEKILHLTSVETLPCVGYGISTHQSWSGDTIIIDIRGFLPPIPCYPEMDVAQTQIRLIGNKTRMIAIKFRWNNAEDVWKAVERGNAFHVTPLKATFTKYSP